MSDTLRQRIARWIGGAPAAAAAAPAAPPRRVGQRMYHAARTSRLTAGWSTLASSADAELSTSLSAMRGHARALVRDAGYARRARNVVINNVIGPGIGLQAQVMTSRGELSERINADIERAWREWCLADNCHTAGRMHFHDLERQLMAQVFEAGEVIVRLHRRAFGASDVPLALEVVESERIADQYVAAARPVGGNGVRLGIEVDGFGRPVAFYLHDWHFADVSGRVGVTAPDQVRRVDAADIVHLYVCTRSPQSRGEPWMHAGMRKLNDMDGYSEAEIVAARANANVAAFIESPEAPPDDDDGSAAGDDSAAPVLELEPGMVEHLAPGEKLAGFAPSRPNPNMDPFMRMMLREMASSVDVSYESLSRDYSQSNYSSSRLALLDDRDTWVTLQQWFIRTFRERLHREWMQAAVLARAIPAISVAEYATNPAKFTAVKWKPRGWSWVDPTREVQAYKEAVKAGFTTVTDVISRTADGQDIEDVLQTRQRELAMAKARGINLDTTVPDVMPGTAPAAAPAKPADDDDTEGGAADRARRVVPIAARAA